MSDGQILTTVIVLAFHRICPPILSGELIRWQEKKHTPATTRNSTTETKKRKNIISCYILEIVQLIPILKKNSCYVLETVELIPE